MGDSRRLRVFRAVVFVAGAILVQASAQAQTATVTASVTVVDDTTTIALRDLHFGSIVPGSAAGTVTIDPAQTGAARLSYSGVTMANTSSISDALFRVTGAPNRYYQIGLPASCAIVNGSGSSMVVDGFRACPISMMVGGTRVYRTRGRFHSHTPGGHPVFYDEFYVGATLHVASGQATGPYRGTFDVSIHYE